MFSDENLGKAIDFVDPKVNSWAKDLFGSFEQLNLTRPQKGLIQVLTVKLSCTIALCQMKKSSQSCLT